MINMKNFFMRLAAVTAGIVMIIAGSAIGYRFFDGISKGAPRVYATPAPAQIQRVDENTTVKYIYNYTDDGEQTFYEEPAPSYLYGLDTDGVKKALRGYEVCELSEDMLVVQKNIQGRSNAHYSIGEKDGYVAVFFESGILKEKTATPVDSLDPSVKAEVVRGIKVDGSEKLAAYLEEIES